MFYHCHFESEIQIQYYCILRIHACVPLKFPLQKKKKFLFVYQFVARRLYFVVRNNLKLKFCELTWNIYFLTVVTKLFFKVDHCCCFVPIVM